MKKEKALTLAVAGNPNAGKSTFFNALTGSKQVVGNWPGVTVEQKLGLVTFADGSLVEVVDLPGIYSLHAVSEDERVAADYALSDEPDVIINVVDGVNLERNLFLTLALMELGKPVVVVVSMLDVLKKRGELPDLEMLSGRLGVPVVSAALRERGAREKFEQAVKSVLGGLRKKAQVSYPDAILQLVDQVRHHGGSGRHHEHRHTETGEAKPCEGHTHRHSAHHHDESFVDALLRVEGIRPGAEQFINSFESKEGITPDVLIADARYELIGTLVDGVVKHKERMSFSSLVDKVVLNRILGVPIFLFVMYLLFWFTQVVGGIFIDFFDLAGGAVFVTGVEKVLTFCHAPQWLITLLATGVGSGLQTVATFIPPVFFIFLGLAILEDSGYMARAAYMMDRFMRWLGLPGSAFVPMLVGFGCTVPAIMATRTLSNRRDRLLTIFMTPFMSCGARLPVYALFGAAFFGAHAGMMVFAIYMAGVVLAILTGLLVKHTLFVGEPSPFVMELPEYHVPGLFRTLRSAGQRLNTFLFRAGKVIVVMVLILSVLDAVTVDTKNDEGEEEEISLLAVGGRALTPVFEPMGVEKDNWQASVALFVGLFAKEAVVGTLNSMYSLEDEAGASLYAETPEGDAEAGDEATAEDGEGEEEEEETVWGGIKEGFASIGENFMGLWDGFRDPLGLGDISDDEDSVAEAVDADKSIFAALRAKFTQGPHQAFAYLLFVLLYAPCLAAIATVIREAGAFFGWILIGYLTVLGWCVATLYYQITLGHSALWIAVPTVMLASVCAFFYFLGKRIKIKMIY